MTARMHQVRFTPEQRDRIREAARESGTTMEQHIAAAAATAADAPIPEREAEVYAWSKVVVPDDVWARLTTLSKARNVAISDLIAEAVA